MVIPKVGNSEVAISTYNGITEYSSLQDFTDHKQSYTMKDIQALQKTLQKYQNHLKTSKRTIKLHGKPFKVPFHVKSSALYAIFVSLRNTKLSSYKWNEDMK